jgi:hypothetical protein
MPQKTRIISRYFSCNKLIPFLTTLLPNVKSLCPSLRANNTDSNPAKNCSLIYYITTFFLGAYAKFLKSTVSSAMSVRPSISVFLLAPPCLSVPLPLCLSARNNSTATGRIFVIFNIWGFFGNLPWKFKCQSTLQKERTPYMKTYVHIW